MTGLLLFPLGCGKSNPPNDQGTSPHTFPATTQATTQSAAAEQALADKLDGTWVAKDVDAKLGQVKIKLVFRQQGRMKLAAWSDIPFVGQVRNKTAPYEVEDHTIHSDAIRGGTTVKFWFDGDDLIIAYKEGKRVRFTRQ